MEGLSKTPDEIKRGLGWCSRDTTLCAEACPYYGSLSNGVECASELQADALAYIQQLERERDAAVGDIEESEPCFACKYFKRNAGNCAGGKRCLRLAEIAERNGGTYKGKFFEWRGVKDTRTGASGSCTGVSGV